MIQPQAGGLAQNGAVFTVRAVVLNQWGFIPLVCEPRISVSTWGACWSGFVNPWRLGKISDVSASSFWNADGLGIRHESAVPSTAINRR